MLAFFDQISLIKSKAPLLRCSVMVNWAIFSASASGIRLV